MSSLGNHNLPPEIFPQNLDKEDFASLIIGRLVQKYSALELNLRNNGKTFLHYAISPEKHIAYASDDTTYDEEVENIRVKLDNYENERREIAKNWKRAALLSIESESLKSSIERYYTFFYPVSQLRHDIVHGYSGIGLREDIVCWGYTKNKSHPLGKNFPEMRKYSFKDIINAIADLNQLRHESHYLFSAIISEIKKIRARDEIHLK